MQMHHHHHQTTTASPKGMPTTNYHPHMMMTSGGQQQTHDMSNSNNNMGMMKMYFHFGYNEVILFDFWRIDSVGGLIGSMIACFILAFGYEALRFYRDSLARNHFNRAAAAAAAAAAANNPQPQIQPANDEQRRGDGYNVVENEEESGSSGSVRVRSPSSSAIRTLETNMLSKGHLALTVLQGVQVTLAYLLMLIFMTYNVWLCLATVLGAVIGYWAFGWRRIVLLQHDAEPCH